MSKKTIIIIIITTDNEAAWGRRKQKNFFVYVWVCIHVTVLQSTHIYEFRKKSTKERNCLLLNASRMKKCEWQAVQCSRIVHARNCMTNLTEHIRQKKLIFLWMFAMLRGALLRGKKLWGCKAKIFRHLDKIVSF